VSEDSGLSVRDARVAPLREVIAHRHTQDGEKRKARD